MAGRAPVPGGDGGAGRVAGERGGGPVRGLEAVGLHVAGPVRGGRDRRAARRVAAAADLAVAAAGRGRGAGVRAAPGASPLGRAADRVRGRPARRGPGAVAGDGAPGAGAQRPGGPAGAAAQAQVQAVAAGDADGAVAAGPGRRDLPGRRAGVQAAVRHRRPLPVRGLRGRARDPVGEGGRRRVHRRDEDLRGAVGGADRQRQAVHRPVHQAAPGGGAVRAGLPRARHHRQAHRPVLADHHREGGAVAPDPAPRAARCGRPVRRPALGPGGDQRLGARLQPRPAAPGPGHGHPRQPVPPRRLPGPGARRGGPAGRRNPRRRPGRCRAWSCRRQARRSSSRR